MPQGRVREARAGVVEGRDLRGLREEDRGAAPRAREDPGPVRRQGLRLAAQGRGRRVVDGHEAPGEARQGGRARPGHRHGEARLRRARARPRGAGRGARRGRGEGEGGRPRNAAERRRLEAEAEARREGGGPAPRPRPAADAPPPPPALRTVRQAKASSASRSPRRASRSRAVRMEGLDATEGEKPRRGRKR